MILSTVDYKQITSFLEDPSSRRLTRNPTDSQNEKPHYCLKNPLLQKIYTNNCVLLAPDPQDCMYV
jgi:hypothetical protein